MTHDNAVHFAPPLYRAADSAEAPPSSQPMTQRVTHSNVYAIVCATAFVVTTLLLMLN